MENFPTFPGFPLQPGLPLYNGPPPVNYEMPTPVWEAKAKQTKLTDAAKVEHANINGWISKIEPPSKPDAQFDVVNDKKLLSIMNDKKVVKNLDVNAAGDVYYHEKTGPYELFFIANSKVHIYKDGKKFKESSNDFRKDTTGANVSNTSRNVQIYGPNVYFLSYKLSLVHLDLTKEPFVEKELEKDIETFYVESNLTYGVLKKTGDLVFKNVQTNLNKDKSCEQFTVLTKLYDAWIVSAATPSKKFLTLFQLAPTLEVATTLKIPTTSSAPKNVHTLIQPTKVGDINFLVCLRQWEFVDLVAVKRGSLLLINSVKLAADKAFLSLALINGEYFSGTTDGTIRKFRLITTV